MPIEATLRADYAALNDLIVNCPEFDRLEAVLGGFNLFQVLRFEYGEIRHSNVLAWIFDPAGSHGLDATFLKKWLMRVVHESSAPSSTVVSAIDIDGWQFEVVEVRREWRNIDVLLVLTLANRRKWVVCLENKINSTQHSSQLPRYRATVETEFPDAAGHLFIFLTRSDETPEDEAYLAASYTQVHKALKECLEVRDRAIAAEPRMLLENYIRLLEEKFMDESEIARLALRIYQQHRRALDVIFEHRPDNLLMASESLRQMFAKNASELGIIMTVASKAYIRFVPHAWSQPGNTHGTAWVGSNRTILLELKLVGSQPRFEVVTGKAPDSWIAPLWARAASRPFRRPKGEARSKTWCVLHSAERMKIALDDDESFEPGEIARRIYQWCVACYQSAEMQDVIRLIAEELPRLEDISTSPEKALSE